MGKKEYEEGERDARADKKGESFPGQWALTGPEYKQKGGYVDKEKEEDYEEGYEDEYYDDD